MLASPSPANRAGGFPASGFPVRGLTKLTLRRQIILFRAKTAATAETQIGDVLTETRFGNVCSATMGRDHQTRPSGFDGQVGAKAALIEPERGLRPAAGAGSI